MYGNIWGGFNVKAQGADEGGGQKKGYKKMSGDD